MLSDMQWPRFRNPAVLPLQTMDCPSPSKPNNEHCHGKHPPHPESINSVKTVKEVCTPLSISRLHVDVDYGPIWLKGKSAKGRLRL